MRLYPICMGTASATRLHASLLPSLGLVGEMPFDGGLIVVSIAVFGETMLLEPAVSPALEKRSVDLIGKGSPAHTAIRSPSMPPKP